MGVIDYAKVPGALPLQYTTVSNTANNTVQFDLSINPPQYPTGQGNRLGVVITSICCRIVDSGATTITLAFDGVDVFAFQAGTSTGSTNGSLTIISSEGLWVSGPNQTVRLRTGAQGTARTVSMVSMTGKIVCL